MSTSALVDFKAVKSAVTMEEVLRHYGLFDRFKRSGENLTGPCPIHKGGNPTQFRVSLAKNIWNCFSECKGGGNVLDFIAKMEDVSIHAAALKAIEWFDISAEATTRSEKKERQRKPPQDAKTERSSKPETPVENETGPNKPLQFRLDKLDRNHPYLAARGISAETITEFGIGYCGKGIMFDRIAIPIHNVEGQVVAYAGRTVLEVTGEMPKYKLPTGFRKAQELFNADRAFKEPADKPLVIVEGFFDCVKLHQLGCRRVVALMGNTMSEAQEEIIRKRTDGNSRIIVMLDEDEAGRGTREGIAARIAKFAFVRLYVFETEGRQPEDLSTEEIDVLIC